jgi:soluble lytic murein transglycosylase-like protein
MLTNNYTMQKAANLILFIAIFLVLSIITIKEGSSTRSAYDTETTLSKYVKFLEFREIDRRQDVEQHLYDSLIAKPSIKWLLTGFTERQIQIESKGQQSAIGPMGEVGIAQFMPDTWSGLLSKQYLPYWFNIKNESHQRIAQLIYLDHLYAMWHNYPTDRRALTVASYNAGPGKILFIVRKYGSVWRDSIPVSTKKYLNNLKSYI